MVHNRVFECTEDTYTQWFQTRLIHRILFANSFLFKMNISVSKLYTFGDTMKRPSNTCFMTVNTLSLSYKVLQQWGGILTENYNLTVQKLFWDIHNKTLT